MVNCCINFVLLIILTTNCCCPLIALEQFSTIRVRIAQKGLQLLNKITPQIVEEEIWKVTLPQITIPIEDGPGTGEVNVTQITLRAFKSPFFSLQLAPPNGIIWKSKGGSAKEGALWLAGYYLIVPIYLSGYVKAQVDDIRLYMQTDLVVQNERPHIEITDCAVDTRQISVYITGGVIQWIVNLFRTQLAYVVKQTVHEKMCDIIRNTVVDINAALSTLPSQIKLYRNLYIGYSFKQKPVVTSKYIEGEMVFDVTYGQSGCILPTEPMDYKVDSKGQMAHIWMSEFVPNCLLKTVYDNENLTFDLTSNTSAGRFGSFLRTDCNLLSICIGKFLPDLRLMYPKQTTYLVIQLTDSPYIVIDTNGVRIFASSTVDLHLSPKKQQSHRLARLVPVILHQKVLGTVTNVTVTLREHDSTVGHFNVPALELLEKILAKSVKLIGGTAIRIGIPLPLIDNVTIADGARIVTRNGYMRVDFDFTYG